MACLACAVWSSSYPFNMLQTRLDNESGTCKNRFLLSFFLTASECVALCVRKAGNQTPSKKSHRLQSGFPPSAEPRVVGIGTTRRKPTKLIGSCYSRWHLWLIPHPIARTTFVNVRNSRPKSDRLTHIVYHRGLHISKLPQRNNVNEEGALASPCRASF